MAKPESMPMRSSRSAMMDRFVRLSLGSSAAAAILWLVCLMTIAGCASFRVTGAENTSDFAAEEGYKAIYADQMAMVHGAIQVFLPSTGNPGVCNKGGTKQGCFDADVKAILTLQAMAKTLESTSVPPRYVQGDKLLKNAIAENIRGLELRNKGIAEQDDAAFTEHKTVLAQAIADYAAAYQAFPGDNRPEPAP